MEKKFDGIVLSGSADFIRNTEAALALILRVGEDWYEFVRAYIGKIKESEQSGIVVYAKPPTFEVGRRTFTSSVTWYSSSIVHDANHSYLYKTGKVYHGRDAERSCMELQMRYLKICGAPANEIAHLKRIYDTDYDYYSSPKIDW